MTGVEDVGLIIGSGLSRLGLGIVSRSPAKTPFGEPSSPVLTINIANRRVRCIARHGERHTIPPHRVNYRANIWCLHQHGVRRCIAVNTVGTMAADFPPGRLALPEQIIDYTWGRAHTFADDSEHPLHVDFTEPFDPALRERMARAAAATGFAAAGGVCGVVQGPRLETAAEIERMVRDGCTMVGMTAMPEAALARELGMAYAVCAVAVNHAAGRCSGETIHQQLERYLDEGMQRVRDWLEQLIPTL